MIDPPLSYLRARELGFPFVPPLVFFVSLINVFFFSAPLLSFFLFSSESFDLTRLQTVFMFERLSGGVTYLMLSLLSSDDRHAAFKTLLKLPLFPSF